LLHVYYLPEPAQVAPTQEVYLPALEDHLDCLALVPPQWMHATLVKITRPAETIDDNLRGTLATALKDGLANLPKAKMIAGPAVAGASAIMLDLTPDKDWNRLRDAAAAIVTDVLGPGNVSIGGGRPHLTLAYGIGNGDSGAMGSGLRRATDLRLPLVLDRLHLVEVTQHPEPDTYGYRWSVLAELGLSTSTPSP
jgi:hypothetical protein